MHTLLTSSRTQGKGTTMLLIARKHKDFTLPMLVMTMKNQIEFNKDILPCLASSTASMRRHQEQVYGE